MTQMTDFAARPAATRHSLPDVQSVQVSIFQELRRRELIRAATEKVSGQTKRRRMFGGLFHTLACGASGLCPTVH